MASSHGASRTNWIWLRGLGRESEHWRPEIEAASVAGVEHHFIDLPGAGQRYRERCPSQVSEMAAMMRPHLPKDKGAVLIGLSLGGMVAAELFAHQSEGHFQALVLINSSTAALSSFYHRAMPQSWPTMLLGGSGALSVAAAERRIWTRVRRSPVDPAVHQRYVELALRRPVTRATLLHQLLAAARYRMPLGALRGKSVAVLAGFGDAMVDPRCSVALAHALGASLYVHPKGGHDLVLDELGWSLNTIKTFAQQVGAQAS